MSREEANFILGVLLGVSLVVIMWAHTGMDITTLKNRIEISEIQCKDHGGADSFSHVNKIRCKDGVSITVEEF